VSDEVIYFAISIEQHVINASTVQSPARHETPVRFDGRVGLITFLKPNPKVLDPTQLRYLRNPIQPISDTQHGLKPKRQ